MHPRLRNTLQVIAFIVVVSLIWIAIPVQAQRAWTAPARAALGAIEGDTHFVCDREFLLANPLQCSALGDDSQRCAAERAMFRRCLCDEIKASPMGSP